MRFRIALILGSVAAVTAVFVATGQAASGFKVTGGGQTDVGTRGAGDTIALTAQENNSGIVGQVQYVDREGGTGQGQVVYHGVVTCVEAVDAGEQGAAYIGGHWTHGSENEFEIYVEDGGEPNQGRDMIAIDPNDTADCVDDDPTSNEDTAALARGNIQIHPAE